MKSIWHPWLYINSERPVFTEKQHESWEGVMSKLQLCHQDYKSYVRIEKPVYMEFDKGRNDMRREFKKLDINPNI